LIRGDGSPTSDSNVALVSDREYIMTPKARGSPPTALLNSNAYSPAVNVHVEGGA
jgi:hypothetical protein